MGLGTHGGGVAAARYYGDMGHSIRITDLQNEFALAPQISQLNEYDIHYSLNGHRKEDFLWADLIVKSPAVSPEHGLLKSYQGNITTDTVELFAYLADRKDVQVIAVSGTKGKSSAVHAIAHILNGKGEQTVVSGNIGVSGFTTIRDLERVKGGVTLVMELSSFQIRDLSIYTDIERIRFNRLFLTSLYPDHQDYYESVDSYYQEKLLLYRARCEKIFVSEQAAQVLLTLNKGIDQPFRPYTTIAQIYGIDSVLPALPHRNQLVGRKGFISFWDDSAATIPEATIFTLNRHPAPVILIFGGSDKNSDYTVLMEYLAKCTALILLEGEATQRRILPLLEDVKLPYHGPYDTMASAIRKGYEVAGEYGGEIDILLSPAAASFSLFRNSDERGDLFTHEVHENAHV